jgi:DNA-directed RNA polymerase specialized sigma24 family protein
MRNLRAVPVLIQLRSLAARREASLPDAQLIEHYLDRRDATAFAALVERHGPMVLGVCRFVLRQREDAEDAFQATFLVLRPSSSGLRRTTSTR